MNTYKLTLLVLAEEMHLMNFECEADGLELAIERAYEVQPASIVLRMSRRVNEHAINDLGYTLYQYPDESIWYIKGHQGLLLGPFQDVEKACNHAFRKYLSAFYEKKNSLRPLVDFNCLSDGGENEIDWTKFHELQIQSFMNDGDYLETCSLNEATRLTLRGVFDPDDSCNIGITELHDFTWTDDVRPQQALYLVREVLMQLAEEHNIDGTSVEAY